MLFEIIILDQNIINDIVLGYLSDRQEKLFKNVELLVIFLKKEIVFNFL